MNLTFNGCLFTIKIFMKPIYLLLGGTCVAFKRRHLIFSLVKTVSIKIFKILDWRYSIFLKFPWGLLGSVTTTRRFITTKFRYVFLKLFDLLSRIVYLKSNLLFGGWFAAFTNLTPLLILLTINLSIFFIFCTIREEIPKL